ncbi:hypothetical protein CPB85DRAFT_1453355 [Mucidula mucida]|nr:hypothetical protein CPB85DRAFT_1453355 [Mucidula mucida]
MSPQPQSAYGAITRTHDTDQPMTMISATILSLRPTTLISMGRHATKQRRAARGYKQLRHCAIARVSKAAGWTLLAVVAKKMHSSIWMTTAGAVTNTLGFIYSGNGFEQVLIDGPGLFLGYH